MSGISFVLGSSKPSSIAGPKLAFGLKGAQKAKPLAVFQADSSDDEGDGAPDAKKQRTASNSTVGAAPPAPRDPEVQKVADKLAEFVSKNGRSFEEITRQRNPGDTPFKFLFEPSGPDFKYYEWKLRQYLGLGNGVVKPAAGQASPQQPASAPPPQSASYSQPQAPINQPGSVQQGQQPPYYAPPPPSASYSQHQQAGSYGQPAYGQGPPQPYPYSAAQPQPMHGQQPGYGAPPAPNTVYPQQPGISPYAQPAQNAQYGQPPQQAQHAAYGQQAYQALPAQAQAPYAATYAPPPPASAQPAASAPLSPAPPYPGPGPASAVQAPGQPGSAPSPATMPPPQAAAAGSSTRTRRNRFSEDPPAGSAAQQGAPASAESDVDVEAKAKAALKQGDSLAAMEAFTRLAAKHEESREEKEARVALLNETSFDRRRQVAVYKNDGTRGHHMQDFIPEEELAKFMTKANDPNAKAMAERVEANSKISADNKGYALLAKMGWKEGQGLGANASGMTAPIAAGGQGQEKLGLGAAAHGEVEEGDDAFETYRKRMMLGYKHRPNPLGNPRKAYY